MDENYKNRPKNDNVYAIIRSDASYLLDDSTQKSLNEKISSMINQPSIIFSVKKIVLSIEEAEKEVNRLNELVKQRGWDNIIYSWQTTRIAKGILKHPTD